MLTLAPITLTTERLKLRWLDQSDAAAQYAIFSDPVVTRYWSSGAWTEMSQAHEAIEKTIENYRSGAAFRLGIELLSTGEMIGNVNLYDIVGPSRRCDIGYAVNPAHWGKGYIGEAMKAALDYAFNELDMNRIEADIDPRNEVSQKILERMGFIKEGYMRERWIVNGEVCDTAFYGLLRRDWKNR